MMTNSSKNQDFETPAAKRAEKWDRTITVAIIILLALPLPFARFETWPHGAVFFDRLVTPWSRFRICYTSPAENEIREDVYGFKWNGRLQSGTASSLNLFLVDSVGVPLLKWQDYPDTPLKDMVHRGKFLRVETFWQPLLLWPFQMAWHIREDGGEADISKPGPVARNEG